MVDCQYVIDALKAAYIGAKIYLAKPWVRNEDVNADIQAGWIDTIVANNPGVVFAGHDERIWLKGADNGATMTTDGVHYSVAGNAEVINQWETTLGY